MAGTVASCLRKQEKEKTEISEITDYLYLSGCAGLTSERLANLGVTAAVCCIRGITHKFSPTVEYLYVPIEDDDTEDLRPHMAAVLALIDEHKKVGRSPDDTPKNINEKNILKTDTKLDDLDLTKHSGLTKTGKTLVYCGLGISRSATFVIAYLMMYEHLTLIDAYKYVQKRRPIICPNVGFFRQLIEIEIELFGRQTVNIIKPVENVEVPDVVWDEVYDEVMQRLNTANEKQNQQQRLISIKR